MKFLLSNSLDELPTLPPAAVTIGSYDGVHAGHREMVTHLCESARRRSLASVLVTFNPHHRVYFGREREPFLLTTIEEKRVLLQKTGVETVVVLPFVQELAQLTAHEFFRRVLVPKCSAKLLLIGHDQALGSDQCAGLDAVTILAKPFGVDVISPPAVCAADEPVSSTRVRALIRSGDIAGANRLLRHPYLLVGTVIHGHGRGRSLGFPTANLSLPDAFKLVPPDGVYAVTATIGGQQHIAMGYVGTRPTFGETDPVIEIAVLDERADLYGQSMEVHFVDRIRADRTFATRDELTAQIHRDEEKTRSVFAELSPG
jgi:riboflavin kinase/FMN adenylyltransferase